MSTQEVPSQSIHEQVVALEAQLATLKRMQAVEQIRALIEAHDLGDTFKEVKANASAPKKLHYRNPANGEVVAVGSGRKPKWLADMDEAEREKHRCEAPAEA
ncbi:H-NS histone family protein [Paraburkholderia sp. Ac-20340]|uniref:H-NS histone family protein n=1 Tax=Paraburkholderia sp. Ac-20340 TaxID=2703888 RepID=UPI001981B29C|nr:H-NS histone family protein [Paraburkholderia sp. Ac-20340]